MKQLISNGSSNSSGAKAEFEFEQHKSKKSSKSSRTPRKPCIILDLYIKTEDSIFVYKLLDQKDKFSFFIVQMPHMSTNIPSTNLYGYIFLELFPIARCTLRIADGYI